MLEGDSAQIVAVREDVSFHGLRKIHLDRFFETKKARKFFLNK